MHDAAQTFLIALGGNMPSVAGTPEETLRAGLARLDALIDGEMLASAPYRTPCFPPGAGPDYVNAAARVQHRGTPEEMLALLHRVETEFGRARVQRWGQRTLDLDLIAAGDAILPDRETHEGWRNLPLDRQQEVAPEQLVLPHPRLQDRAFVLVPLADVAPNWKHPVLGLTVVEMLTALPAQAIAEVVALTE